LGNGKRLQSDSWFVNLIINKKIGDNMSLETPISKQEYNDLKAEYDKLPTKTKDLHTIYTAWVLVGDDEEWQFIGSEGNINYIHPEDIEAIQIFPNWELLQYGMLEPNPYYKQGGGKRDNDERDNLLYAHDVIHDTLEFYWKDKWNLKLLEKYYDAWKEIVDDQEYEVYKELVIE
jgi:hypothetical protein